jgi:hypothetical protein
VEIGRCFPPGAIVKDVVVIGLIEDFQTEKEPCALVEGDHTAEY